MINKKIIVLALISIVLLIIITWLRGHSYIEITVKNPSQSSITYSLSSDNGKNLSELEDRSPKVKRLVSSGDYEIMVKQNQTSYFSVIRTKGFLRTSTVEVELQEEKNRTFVGNSPAFCMYYDQTIPILYSYNCAGTYTELNLHVPATQELPTYNKNPESPDFSLASVIQLSGVTYALLNNVQAEEGVAPPKALYKLKQTLALDEWVDLAGLNRNTSYFAKNYQEGFITYNETFSEIKYFNNINSQPLDIPAKSPANNDYEPIELSTKNNTIAALYVEEISHDDEGLDSKGESGALEPIVGGSEVIVYQDNSARHFEFNFAYSSVLACGSQKLCLLSGKKLDIYDISSDEPKIHFSVTGVDDMEMSGDTLLVSRINEVIGLDVDNKVGSIQYSYGGYSYCGLQSSENGYTVCVVDEAGDTMALFIDPNQTNVDSLDKKIFELRSIAEISKVSAYGNLIYVSPEAGERIYRSDIGGYGYDLGVLNAANQAINQKVDEVDIDRSRYTIINPYQ